MSFVACGGSGTNDASLIDGGTAGVGATGGNSGSGGSGGSAGASGAAGGGGIGGAAGAADDGGVDAEADACTKATFEQSIKPLAAYVLLDNSGSMTGTNLSYATSGLTTFFGAQESAGMVVALGYFPGTLDTTASCTPSSYETPAVGFYPLSWDPAPADVHEQALATSLANLSATGTTPMYPALLGALTSAKAHALQNSQSEVIVLLITDGEPTGCTFSTNNPQTIADTAAAFATGTPPVRTHTVGLPGSNQLTLKTIATAGQGTFHDLGPTFSAQKLVEAVNAIRVEALPCDLPLPTSVTDPNTVALSFTNGSGVVTDLVKVQNAAACTLNGWYFETDPTSGQPVKVVLCGDVCTATQNDPKSKIVLSVSCS
jgi:hypothetical protein